MYYILFCVLILINMLFFGVINISLFKYFCDLPSFDNLNAVAEINISPFMCISNCIGVYSYLYNNIYTCFLFMDIVDYFISFHNYMKIYFFFFSNEKRFDSQLVFSNAGYIEVFFQTSSSNFNFVEFCSLQRFIYTVPNETHLIFFRMYNSVMFEVCGVSIYLIYPADFSTFFNKIQCFCFEELLLYPYETIDLPVVFYISNEAFNFVDFYYSNKLYLSYLLLIK
ncbi:heme biosynthesis protein (mitochondrion) [Naegleria fowleri]|uniref:Cox11 n=1 Tax=Naegleria fowleri TaxID=5763 RepID=M4H5Q6_NAEFO|nr:heme biosynthesis protein [Naegleria fowleri]AFP72301.1 heme biosynthesis protein [Naegleria fowleri]AOS85626.1 Cox11 [Naegleria fowleri]AOS85672.1 Cox11 [Naegleria fowleri]UAT97068.1 heme biosynthesis protein [Naegleria fowleri]WND64438.1 cytochrome c oxidase assembly protein CtaG [Naegleria fowleri]